METPSKIALGIFLVLVIVVSGFVLASMGSGDRDRSEDGPETPQPTEPEKVPEPITRHTVIFSDTVSSRFLPTYSYFYRATGEKAPFIEPNSNARYVFKGWNYNGQPWNFNNPVKTDMILESNWSEHFTVDLDASTMIATVTVCDDWREWNNIIDWNDGSTSAIPADTDSISHEYAKNDVEITMISYNGSETYTSSHTELFYPAHKPLPWRYKVHFHDEGWNEYAVIEVSHGKKASSARMPAQNGKQFLGWYSEGKEWDFNEPIMWETHLFAKWKDDESLKIQHIEPVVDVTKVTGGIFLDASKTEGVAHYEWYFEKRLVSVSDTIIVSPELTNWNKYGNNVVLKFYSESRSEATWEQYFPA